MMEAINEFIKLHPIGAFLFCPLVFIAVCIIGAIMTAPTIDKDDENF